MSRRVGETDGKSNPPHRRIDASMVLKQGSHQTPVASALRARLAAVGVGGSLRCCRLFTMWPVCRLAHRVILLGVQMLKRGHDKLAARRQALRALVRGKESHGRRKAAARAAALS